MKKLLTIILTITTLVLAAIFNWHGETAQAETTGGGDHTKILYSCFTGNSSNGQQNLCVMNADGSGKYQIPDPNNVILDANSPRFDVNAEKILFLSKIVISQGNLRYRLAIVNADGTNPQILFDGAQYDANDHDVIIAGFSPDGSKIAFVTRPRNGEIFDRILWIINSDGSGLTQIAAGNIYAHFPLFTNGIQQSDVGIQYISFSPDGRKVAVSIYDSGNYTIYLVNVDGSGMTRLADSQNPLPSYDPVFSPDGSKIVFTEHAGFGIYNLAIRNIDGSNKIVLADQGINFTASFNPNGDKIVFHSTRNSTSQSNLFASYDIYTINPDGTNETRLTFNSVPSKSGLATFDPFGERIVFNASPAGGFQDMEVYTMNPNGNSVTVLTDSPGEHSAFNPSYGNGDLDGDGVKNTLDNCRLVSNPNQTNTDGDVEGNACDADDDNDSIDDEFDNCPLAVNYYRVAFSSGLFIYTMNENGSGRTQLTFGPTTYREIEPEFNRAGSRIVFQSNRTNNRNEIYSMKPDGTDITQLTNIAGGNQQPSYSPDGSKIVFSSRRTRPNNQGSTDLYVMNADGSNQVGLGIATNTFAAEHPTFNQDGTRIAYFAGRLTGPTSNTQDIYTINPDGTNETRLTTAAGVDNQPAFSPDGSKIAFVSFRGGDTDGEIYVMNADGTNQTRLTDDTREDRNPTFTPDGTKITFTDRVDSQLSRINVDGTGLVRLTNSFGYLYPSYTTQPDADRDGTGDTCDDDFDANTPTGANVAVQAPNANVSFSNVSQSGTTSFTPITPNQNDLPTGYTLCPTCPAYEITTTATVTPPIEVCLGVPASVTPSLFLQMRLLHGEGGTLVDRTTNRFTDGNGQRFVCGSVNSLSPFVLASNAAPTAAQVSVGGRVSANGRGVNKATVTLTDASGSSRYAMTNAFGFYRFDEVEVGQTYIVSVRRKQFTFAPQIINPADELTDINFTPEEN